MLAGVGSQCLVGVAELAGLIQVEESGTLQVDIQAVAEGRPQCWDLHPAPEEML